MRELMITEIETVSGAAWWSPSNIMNFIHDITHSSSESNSWFIPDGSPSGSLHIGEAIGVGISVVTGVAGFAALAAVTNTVTAGFAGIFGIAAFVRKFKG